MGILCIYEDIAGNKMSFEAACVAHLYDEEDFQYTHRYSGDDENLKKLDLYRLRKITAYGLKPRGGYRLFSEYKRMILAYLDEFITEDFGLEFRLETPKAYVLALLDYLRPPHEEGEWFMRAMLEGEGSPFKRLRRIHQDLDDGSHSFYSTLHQSMLHTITERPDHELEHLDKNFDDFLYWLLDNADPIVGSVISPPYEGTVDYYVGQWLEENF